jgi:putative ABC transport system permease protein
MSLLQRSALGVYRQHPWQSLLMLVGMVLSVAVVVAIDLVIVSAQRGFELSQRALTGDASHSVLREGDWLEESLLATLRRDMGVRPALPVLELSAVAEDGKRLRLIGVDLLAEAQLRPWLAGAGAGSDLDLSTLLDGSPRVMITDSMAQQLELSAGETLTLRLRGRRVGVTIAALLPAAQIPGSADDLLIMDIGAAQNLAELPGLLSRIDLRLDALFQLDALQQALPQGVRVVESGQRTRQTLDMSRSFAINLRAMSLLALLVGVFLIFQTLRFMVLRRTVVIGLWRALGVHGSEIAGLLLREALLIGLLTGLVGVALGVLLAHALLGMVVTTVNDLYFRLATAQVDADWVLLGKGLALAVGGALAAALLPLREALSVPALGNLGRSRIEQLARRQISQAWPIGVLMASSALVWLQYGPDSLLASFAAVFLLIVGAVLCVPMLTALILDAAGAATRTLPIGLRLALAHARQGLSRTGVAMAALALAMATVIAMSTMIHSFRSSVIDWVDTSLSADIYVSATDPGAVLDDELIETLSALPQIDEVSSLRRLGVMHEDGPLQINSIASGPRGFAGYQWMARGTEDPWRAFLAGRALASEPLARRLNLEVGDTLRIPTPSGSAELTIAAIYRDFSSSQGVLTIEKQRFDALFGERGSGALALFARGDQEAPLLQAVLAKLADRDGVSVLRADSIRRQTLDVFDRTFAITRIIHWLAGAIAFVAILGALLGMELERRRDYLLLRASGFLRRDITRLRLSQSLSLGLIAALLALPFGMLLAWVLVDVINQRAFGWTLTLSFDPIQTLQALALAPLAALLAGLAAGWAQRDDIIGDGLREGMNT